MVTVTVRVVVRATNTATVRVGARAVKARGVKAKDARRRKRKAERVTEAHGVGRKTF